MVSPGEQERPQLRLMKIARDLVEKSGISAVLFKCRAIASGDLGYEAVGHLATGAHP